jgi:serine/threonine-protein kinase
VLKILSVIGLGTAAVTFPGIVGFVTPAFVIGMTVGFSCGVGALIQVQRRRDVDAEFWGRFWTGRVGSWLFKIARAFTTTTALPASLTHRPTELALSMAAEQLFESLPKETRHQLRDLPDVVHRLEQDAQKMRARLEELQEALAGVEQRGKPEPTIAARHDRIVADLSAERDLVQQRLKDAVAALETIRLNLLRLHAGTATVKSLTTDLGLAREIARDIGAQVDGYLELERDLQR